jgi:hypothetical protein
MPRYGVFGFTIESTIAFPELESGAADDSVDWRIRTAREGSCGSAGTALGLDRVYGDVQVRTYASETTLRIVFDDTGVFDLHPRHREIVWYPGLLATEAAVRADVLGRVMALAAHADGHFTLHASAVAVEGRAIALVGPKHAGKSTLALALVRRGARLLTDDTLVVRLQGGAAWAAPGVQRIRLWEDSARALGTFVPAAGEVKSIATLVPNELATTPLPLAACYVLAPSVEPNEGEANGAPIQRERLSPVHAALACVRFSKLGSLGGGAVGAAILDRAGTLTKSVPVYVAVLRPDLTRLDDVAGRVMAWHALARVAGPGAAVR